MLLSFAVIWNTDMGLEMIKEAEPLLPPDVFDIVWFEYYIPDSCIFLDGSVTDRGDKSPCTSTKVL